MADWKKALKNARAQSGGTGLAALKKAQQMGASQSDINKFLANQGWSVGQKARDAGFQQAARPAASGSGASGGGGAQAGGKRQGSVLSYATNGNFFDGPSFLRAQNAGYSTEEIVASLKGAQSSGVKLGPKFDWLANQGGYDELVANADPTKYGGGTFKSGGVEWKPELTWTPNMFNPYAKSETDPYAGTKNQTKGSDKGRQYGFSLNYGPVNYQELYNDKYWTGQVNTDKNVNYRWNNGDRLDPGYDPDYWGQVRAERPGNLEELQGFQSQPKSWREGIRDTDPRWQQFGSDDAARRAYMFQVEPGKGTAPAVQEYLKSVLSGGTGAGLGSKVAQARKQVRDEPASPFQGGQVDRSLIWQRPAQEPKQDYQRSFQSSLASYERQLEDSASSQPKASSGGSADQSQQLQSQLRAAQAERDDARAKAQEYERQRDADREIAVSAQLGSLRAGSTVSGTAGSGIGNLSSGRSSYSVSTGGRSGGILDRAYRDMDPTDSVLNKDVVASFARSATGSPSRSASNARRQGLTSGNASSYYAQRFG